MALPFGGADGTVSHDLPAAACFSWHDGTVLKGAMPWHRNAAAVVALGDFQHAGLWGSSGAEAVYDLTAPTALTG